MASFLPRNHAVPQQGHQPHWAQYYRQSLILSNFNAPKGGGGVQRIEACNGWTCWRFEEKPGVKPIEFLRDKIRKEMKGSKSNAATLSRYDRFIRLKLRPV